MKVSIDTDVYEDKENDDALSPSTNDDTDWGDELNILKCFRTFE